MSTWFRSLPADLVTKLTQLGSPRQVSGFNVMTCEDLKHLAAAEPPEIIPANPDANALFGGMDGASVVANQIDVDFIAADAIPTHFVHALTSPVDPEEVGLTEPDGWTLAATPVLVSAGAYDAIVVTNTGKDYHVALIVGDTNDLATCTVISGGIGLIATSG